MPSRKAVVRALVGLHARPAAEFVRAVTASGLPVTISKDGTAAADARSLLQVMAADFQHGCEVRLEIESETAREPHLTEEAERILSSLAALLESQGNNG
ncbi:HPr family phosphocarrier protein [Pseudarthrobacter sp. NPDC058362]|uniref:HPr family phosphocarrier protein n=1 Tax=unclassified Pseudarthrobacter TaxID=2647000 RepID=UPI00364B482C